MLEVKHISKTYDTGGFKQKALDDISVSFRKCEFAAILGPSGSGKTTLLNIIGGLDHYDNGDLIIENKSTKKYKDRDWDSYRNHRIGFVFQSYNLIGHQTILNNVKLALTLSGISKQEATERAKEALKTVGLEKHMNKKPNQLSGGQMQRVAIARALVNDPEIVLADEPTGALDSETSVQIMKILKEVSKTKLVIMVTHNPELANIYANRIINIKDGKIDGDTNPFEDKKDHKVVHDKTEKTKMSFKTAIGLSFNNLLTKKGRTILVAFAGSIGIIGIALILAVSTGFQGYVDSIQEETLTSYPLTIANETADLTSMLMSISSSDGETNNSNKVVEKPNLKKMVESFRTNDLKSFKTYLDDHYSEVKDDLSSITTQYSIDPIIYTKKKNGDLNKLNPNSLFTSLYGGSSMMSSFSNMASAFTQMLDDQETLNEQYDVVAGRWNKNYNEIMVVLPNANEMNDMFSYFLGLRDMDELTDIVGKIMKGERVEVNNEPLELTYDDFLNLEYKLIIPSDMYRYNKKYDVYEDMSEDESYMKNLYAKAESLKVVGLVVPKDGVSAHALNPGLVYKPSLITHIINEASKSAAVKKQLKDENIDVFSGNKFNAKNKYDFSFANLVKVDEKKLQSAFQMKASAEEIEKKTKDYMEQISNSVTTDLSPAFDMFTSSFKDIYKLVLNASCTDEECIINILNNNETILKNIETNYIIPVDSVKTAYKGLITLGLGLMLDENSILSNPYVIETSNTMAKVMTEAKMKKDILTKVGELTGNLTSSLASGFNVDQNKIASAFSMNFKEEELARVVSALMTKSDKSQSTNLIQLGYQELDKPTMFGFYFKSFDGKEHFMSFIDKYNEEMKKSNKDDNVINYTDATGILMGSVKTIVNAVSYVLIAFVSISLIVSSIMIGVITYISVYERTKEIGILRAMGASKHNISSIFNAETFIIGFLSGLFGIGISYILIPIINAVLHHFTGNIPLSAELEIGAACILIIISVILTLIGGLIPAKKASKKDPVIALRTE